MLKVKIEPVVIDRVITISFGLAVALALTLYWWLMNSDLAPLVVQEVFRVVQRLRQEGITVLRSNKIQRAL